MQADWNAALDSGPLWMFALFMVAGELLPIHVPRTDGFEEVTTISGAFAFAALLLFGFGVAAAVYAAASLVSSLAFGIARSKLAFNAGQYVLSLAAAAGTLALLGDAAPVDSVSGALPAVLAAIAALFIVENFLIEAGLALLRGESPLRALSHEIGFHAWTAGALLAVGPLLATAARESAWLVPLAFAPILAIFLGGRQAVISRNNALHDPLTGLPNRNLFVQRLADELARAAEGTTIALTKIDLRDFRTINEALGHEQGDFLLQTFAERLKDALAPGEILARIGSDEFALIGISGSPEVVAERAAALQDALYAPFQLGDIAIDVPAHIGIALYPFHADSADSLMKRARVALTRAKEERASCKVYAPEFDDSNPTRLALATELRRGIGRGELVLYYQPKVALRDRDEYEVEALVRWRHPQLGLLAPNAFVPLAEHTGLIRPLTRFVLESAVNQCAKWRSEGLAVRVSVNLSPQSLLDSGLPILIDDLLDHAKLPASALQLEITERGIIGDLPRGRAILTQLAANGVTSAIDDFGTGYASLAHLQALPVSEIKIDRSFVSRMTSEPQSAAIVASTIGLGRSLNLAITAEGVETPQEYARLEELGCDFVQGYFISRPVPAEDCPALFAAPRPTTALASVE